MDKNDILPELEKLRYDLSKISETVRTLLDTAYTLFGYVSEADWKVSKSLAILKGRNELPNITYTSSTITEAPRYLETSERKEE